MKEIKGTQIQKLGFSPQKIGDLIYHEGPLLSLFIDKENTDMYYLYKWADCDEISNRWLIIHLNSITLKSFFFKDISLRNLFLNHPFVYVVNLDDNLFETEIMICSTNNLPEEYLPKENSFFNEEKYSEFASTFKSIIAGNKIYEILSVILKEINNIKKSQSSTYSLLTILLDLKKTQSITSLDSILYSKQEFNYEQILN